MVFSTPVFLFGFLPLALLVYYLSPQSLRNKILLLFSLVFTPGEKCSISA